jgi:hypothetical protein
MPGITLSWPRHSIQCVRGNYVAQLVTHFFRRAAPPFISVSHFTRSLLIAVAAVSLSCSLARFSAATARERSATCCSALATLLFAAVNALFVLVNSLDVVASSALAVVSLLAQ